MVGSFSHFLTLFITTLIISGSIYGAEIEASPFIIHWIHTDAEPGVISSGPNKGKGYNQELQKIFEKNMPQFEHSGFTVSIRRFVKLLNHEYKFAISSKNKRKSGQVYCMVGATAHPTLDLDDYLSMAIRPYEGHYLVTRKNETPIQPNKNGDVLFSSVLDNSQISGILTASRPHFNILSEVKKFQDLRGAKANIKYVSYGNLSNGLLKLINAGRHDYTFETSVRIGYFFKQHPQLQENLITYPVIENAGWQYNYVSCTRNPNGKVVIMAINKILEKERRDPKFLDFYFQWLLPATRQKVKNYYQDIFLKQPPIFDTNPRSMLDE